MSSRVRRGKLVTIHDEWVGRTTHAQTIRRRQSKRPRKCRRYEYHRQRDGTFATRVLRSRSQERKEAIDEYQR